MTQAWLKVPEMTHEEWLMWRKQGIGGSDAPAIMGVSPWSTPLQKWEEKVFDGPEKKSWILNKGHFREKQARMEFEDLVGVRMLPVNIQNTKEAWLRASLDGMCPNGDKVVEIKYTGKDDHLVALSNKIPDKYYPQCQHILKVTGKDGMYYFSSPEDGSPGKIVEVARDDQYIDQLLTPKEVEFWDYVTSNKAPPLTERDYICMERSRKWKEASQRWKETTKALKDMENQESQIRADLIALSKNHNARGNNLSLTKSVVQGRIDYMKAFEDYVDNLRAHYPEIDFKPISLDPYRKDSFVKWTLRDMS